jgi:hypothetical protein
MAYYAMVVVIDALDAEHARECADPENPNLAEVVFVGEPWQAQPVNAYPDHEIEGGPRGPIFEPEFDTGSLVHQQIENG